MISTLILGCVLSGAAGFLAGWWRGRGDFSADLDDTCGEILESLQKIPTSCACGERFVASCPKGYECPSFPGNQ